MTADKEEKRVIRLFKRKNKIIPVKNYVKKKKEENKRLVVEKSEDRSTVYFIRETKKKSVKLKVGLIIVDAEPFDIDPTNRTVKRKIVIDEGKYWLEHYREALAKIPEQSTGKKGEKRIKAKAKFDTINLILNETPIDQRRLIKLLRRNRRDDLKNLFKQGYKGLLDCYYKGFVKIVNGPGFDFIGDKLFCTLMDQLITYYLKEEPILKTIPTFSFALDFNKKPKKNQPEEPLINETLLNQVFDYPEVQNFVVVKRVDGRGGDSVWVGPKISREEFLQVKEKARKEPEAFIVQKYTALSQVDGQLVDIRCLGSVSNSEIILSETLWGRGVPLEGSNGKVNISDRGFEFAICQSI